MQYRQLGTSSLNMSALSLGTWPSFGLRHSFKESLELLCVALDNGINYVDCAEAYAWGDAELVLGKAIKVLQRSRDSYCVSSKVYYGSVRGTALPTQQGLSKKHIFDACNQSLTRLSLEYLDFFLCHAYDKAVNIEEVVWAMHCLVLQGKIVYWGTSKWPITAIYAAIQFAKKNHLVQPIVEQAEYNPLTSFNVEENLTEVVDTNGLGLMVWSPLKQGLLAGRYDDGVPIGSRFSFDDLVTLKSVTPQKIFERWIQISKSLKVIASELNISRAQLCLAWCLKNRRVTTVLLGCSGKGQLVECLEALSFLDKVTPEVWLKIHEFGGDTL